MRRVVIIEPWFGGSHRAWVEAWRENSRHEIEALTLPARFWRWRMRAGSVELADRFGETVGRSGQPDLVVVSSLLDLAAFAGGARRALGDTPIVLYMHENQLLYPAAPGQRADDSFALINWRSIAAADELWWNSAYHRDALLGALPGLLERQAEPTESSVAEWLSASRVLAPGVETKRLIAGSRPTNERPVVLFNQRWDHDKRPDVVVAALAQLAGEGLDFGLVLAGQDAGRSGLDELSAELAERTIHRGWLERDDYLAMLLRTDVVVSAAEHEYFGIAVVEALAAGAVPVLPNRQSYPELVGPRWRDASLYAEGQLTARLRRTLRDLDQARLAVAGLRGSMGRFDVTISARAHDDAVDEVTAHLGSTA